MIHRCALLVLFLILALHPAFVTAQEPRIEFIRARTMSITERTGDGAYPLQEAMLVTDDSDTVQVTNPLVGDREDLRMVEGQRVILQRFVRPDGEIQYSFQEAYRLPAVLFIFACFLLLGVLVGGWRGLMSIVGLGVSVVIIIFGMFPLIVRGWDAFWVCTLGAFLIAGFTILLSHGWNRRTFLALIATCVTLLCAVLLAVLAVSFSRLFGLGSEESVFLQLDPSLNIDPRGLLLGGIIIGTLGVLDDITTTQVAAVEEIAKANPAYGFRTLYAAGISVGREHIASMINTLVLAYVGVSLPLFLLFFLGGGVPAWVTLNSAFVSEEIVRTLVGSSALFLAVPISNSLAAYRFCSVA